MMLWLMADGWHMGWWLGRRAALPLWALSNAFCRFQLPGMDRQATYNVPMLMSVDRP